MENKVILITGGTGKVGLQLLSHYLRSGWKVIFTSRSLKKGQAVIIDSDLKNWKKNALVCEADFTKPDANLYLTDQIESNKLWPNVIIHNARSIETLSTGAEGISSTKSLMDEYLVDVVVPYTLSMEILKKQSSQQLKNLIFISSMYGIVAPTPALYEHDLRKSPIQYGLAKSAQIHLTKELAVRLADHGIRVNCISFGGIEGRMDQKFLQRYAALTPQKEMLKEEDVIGPVDFLVSEASKNMTGHNLIVDGGWTIW
jgi:NAD(P)-dependent dehydrogenase (short-subunit alcohol dehydrogenase family)